MKKLIALLFLLSLPAMAAGPSGGGPAQGGGGGSGTVTNVAGTHANGFNVTVANPTTSPTVSVIADARLDAGTNLATAVSTCASANTIIVVTQAITVSSNLTIPANCALEKGNGGLITVASGVTLTINSTVTAPVSQKFFAGAGSVQGLTQHNVSPLWFGVPNDCLHGSGTCTDGITQWTAAINSLASSTTGGGGQLYCPAGGYAFTGPILFGVDGTGMIGPDAGANGMSTCELWNKSASTVTVNNAGSGTGPAPYSSGNTFENLLLGRLLTPTAGSIGFRGFYNPEALLNNIISLDSLTQFWSNFAANGNRVQGWNNLGGYWANPLSAPGVNAASYTAGTSATCLLIAAQNGGEFSARFNVADCNDGTHGTSGSLASWAVTMRSTGDMSDIYLDHTQAADTTGGILIDCTNATGADDIQIRDSVFQSGIGLSVLNCPASINTSIALSGGWIGAAVYPLDIENSSGVAVSDVTITGSGISQIKNNTAVELSGVRDIGGGGFAVTNTTTSRFVHNNVTMTGSTTGFSFTNSSYNLVQGNTFPSLISGTGGHGIVFDSASTNNTAIELNKFGDSDYVDGGNISNHSTVSGNYITDMQGGWNMGLNNNSIEWNMTGGGYGFNMYNTNSDTNTNPFMSLFTRATGTTTRSPARMGLATPNGFQQNSLDFSSANSSILFDNGFSSTLSSSGFQCYGGNNGVFFAGNDGKIGWCDGGAETIHWLDVANNKRYYLVTENAAITAASTIAPTTALFHITGTTAVNVMTPLPGMATSTGTNLIGGAVDFIADSITPFAAGTSVGSFGAAFTTVANTPYHCDLTPSTGLWYCK